MTLRPSSVAELVARVTYKPGWVFEVNVDEWDGLTLRAVATVPDSHNPPDGITVLGIDTPIPPLDDARQFLEWLGWRLRRIEAHEVREWLAVDGRRIFEPHPDPCEQG